MKLYIQICTKKKLLIQFEMFYYFFKANYIYAIGLNTIYNSVYIAFSTLIKGTIFFFQNHSQANCNVAIVFLQLEGGYLNFSIYILSLIMIRFFFHPFKQSSSNGRYR